MRSERLRTVVEIALSVALATVLTMWKIKLPWNIAGGSVSLAMVPLFVVALRRGVGPGVVAGVLFSVLDYISDPTGVVHPAQLLMDYPLAFGACGLAGLGSTQIARASATDTPLMLGVRTIPWVLLGGAGRFALHYLSGVIYFGSFAPQGQPVWLYSLLYNLSYLLPSLLITAACTAVLIPILQRAVPVHRATGSAA